MRILHLDLCSSFPLARAGGHRTVHSLLSRLALVSGVSCQSLFLRRGPGSELPAYDPRLADFESLQIREMQIHPGRWIFDCGYPAWAVDRIDEVLPEVLDRYQPEVIWVNSFLSFPLVVRARELGIPAVWYNHDVRPEPGHLQRAAELGVAMVAVSDFVNRRVRGASHGPCETVYPLIREEDYVVEPDLAGGFVTLVNPRPVKGFDTFLEVARGLPGVRFLVVEAWPLGANLAEVERQLAPLGQVTFRRQLADVREIYRQTKLLLVPSVIDDAGPRVIREAQLSGIPVLGSARGGIPEMIGAGGIVIEDYRNPAAWQDAIRAVLADSASFQELSRSAQANARRVDLMTETILGRFHAACRRAMEAGGAGKPN